MFKKLLSYPGKFIASEASSGIFTIAAAALALFMANSFGADGYERGAELLIHPINDWLMIIFFLVIALELKAEMFGGMLSSFKQIMLPLVAAIGGMAVPALIYMACNTKSGAMHGWAVPSATDIAFALSILLIAGRGMPQSMKIFLLAIAIFDDLGAILIIAFFYSEKLALMPLGFCFMLIGVLYLLNRNNVTSLKPYLFFGAVLAYLLHITGIHTTIAGVITGLAIPQQSNKKLMHILHPYSAFLIVPLFAFVNAGVSFEGMSFSHLTRPVTIGIILGLFVGKQLGIFSFAYAAIKLKIASMPPGASFRDIHTISVIAGIGFTMSLFIGILAFSSPFYQGQVKIGVLCASLLSALIGCILLRIRKNLPN